MNEPQNLFADYVFESKDLASMFSTKTAQSSFQADGITWIKIPAGAFGNGCPLTTIEVVSEHLISASGALLELWFGAPNAMIKAGDLIGHFGITKLSENVAPNSSTTRHLRSETDGQFVLTQDEVALLLAMAANQDSALLQLGAASLDEEGWATVPRIEETANPAPQKVKKARRWV